MTGYDEGTLQNVLARHTSFMLLSVIPVRAVTRYHLGRYTIARQNKGGEELETFSLRFLLAKSVGLLQQTQFSSKWIILFLAPVEALTTEAIFRFSVLTVIASRLALNTLKALRIMHPNYPRKV
jgi:hypothetical protein